MSKQQNQLLKQIAPSTGYSPLDAIARGWKLLFVSKGRATRAEFWWFSLVILVAYLVVDNFLRINITLQFININFITLAFVIPQICITARRLHDTGYEGFIVFKAFSLFIISSLLGVYYLIFEAFYFYSIYITILYILALVTIGLFVYLAILCSKESQNSDNDFGPYPFREESKPNTLDEQQ